MKKMIMPQELEVWYLLPTIRKGLAKEMVKGGLSQKAIAEKLGITEAAVSQYMKGKRGSDVDLGNNIKKEIKNSVKNILKGSSVIKEIQRICDQCKREMILCKIHKRHGYVSKGCDICMKSEG